MGEFRVKSARPILVLGAIDTSMRRSVRLGIHACAAARGWSIVSEYKDDPEAVAKWIGAWRPRAVLLSFPKPEALAAAAALAPTVATMGYTDGTPVPAVDLDQDAVGRCAAEHLMGLGLQSFGVLGDWSRRWALERAAGFIQRLALAGLPCARCAGDVFPPSTDAYSGASGPAINRWIASLPKPIGIFACSDPWGQQLANYCRTLGVRVPEDVAIVAVDNDEVMCETSVPPLSSVAVPWQQIGYDAALLAGRVAEGKAVKPTRRLVAPLGVVARQSSDLLACDDPDVIAALRVIRQHADRPLNVTELLRKIPVHRRRLERRFHDLVGRRILHEVRRVHVEQAKRLLISTELPMPEIADRSGFASAAKLAVAFRKEVGRTPTAFRQQFRLRP